MAILLLLVGKIALLDPLISQFALLAAPKTIHFGVLVAVLLARVDRRERRGVGALAAPLPARLARAARHVA